MRLPDERNDSNIDILEKLYQVYPELRHCDLLNLRKFNGSFSLVVPPGYGDKCFNILWKWMPAHMINIFEREYVSWLNIDQDPTNGWYNMYADTMIIGPFSSRQEAADAPNPNALKIAYRIHVIPKERNDYE